MLMANSSYRSRYTQHDAEPLVTFGLPSLEEAFAGLWV